MQLAFLLWELPQSALGAATLLFMYALGKVRRLQRDRGRVLIELRGDGAVSLGLFVFYASCDSRFVPVGAENLDHELGHAIQSRLLGPLYLPLVGVPSALRVLYAIAYFCLHGRRWPGYYAGFPERWADRLGGADIALRPRP